MIRIKTIHVEEFRGIKELDLDLGSQNFGICGPNGTGKSGVVDAIEFCLTGDVTRLSGQGSADLSVKSHAPHVDQKTSPEKASVTIVAEIPSLGKSLQIHRSVKNLRRVQITPDDAALHRVVEELQTHPEFALSRREIVKYIITPPGKRSEDVQTLLRLEHVEKLRKVFNTFCNKRKSEADQGCRVRSNVEADLNNALKIDKLEHALLLEKVNEKRKLLGLQALSELTDDTSFKAGVVVPQNGQKKPGLRKVSALADLTALQSAITEGEPPALVKDRQMAATALKQLKDDENAFTLVRRHAFFKTGLDLIAEGACPLCDKVWDAEELRKHLRQKLLGAEELEQLLEQLGVHINGVLQSLSERIQAVERVIECCQNLGPPIEQAEFVAYVSHLRQSETALAGFLNDQNTIGPALRAVSGSWWSPDTELQVRLDEYRTALNALPDSSAEEEARDFLTVVQERWEKLLDAAKTEEQLNARRDIAQKVLDHYNASCTSVLEGIYNKVAEDFTRYYSLINREDEEQFVSKLTSAPAKLSFDVDFYGRGLFPPGAYHSEGHQDGMGVCLYLALMKHTLGDRFTFAVLDDVLMSVDTAHRREVCRLLKSEFPKTQFIVTTHDRVWLQYMKTEGLIHRSQSFAGWTVDLGPQVWHDQDIWTDIQSAIDRDDVPNAAWLLRRYLEYSARILAHDLRAAVEFRSDGRYDLGDLLPGALKAWKKALEKAESAARSWGRTEEEKAISQKRGEAKKLIARTNAEQWAINPSVHFNEWSNFQPNEFQEVVDAFRELLAALRCGNPDCRSYLRIVPLRGQAEEVRCNCGSICMNVTKR